jgi:hypothetical protein
MKTMIRIAVGLFVAVFVGVSTNCAPEPTPVRHVHHYYNSGKYSGYSGSGSYTSYGSGAEGFEPVERF